MEINVAQTDVIYLFIFIVELHMDAPFRHLLHRSSLKSVGIRV